MCEEIAYPVYSLSVISTGKGLSLCVFFEGVEHNVGIHHIALGENLYIPQTKYTLEQSYIVFTYQKGIWHDRFDFKELFVNPNTLPNANFKENEK